MHKVLQHLLKKFATSKKKSCRNTVWCPMQHGVERKTEASCRRPLLVQAPRSGSDHHERHLELLRQSRSSLPRALPLVAGHGHDLEVYTGREGGFSPDWRGV
jgi:hypothetical protein